MKKLIFLILIILVIGGVFFLWQEIYLPRDSNLTETKIFSVTNGEGSKEIALNLEKAGLIKHSLAFRLYVLHKGISGGLQAGTYELSPSMSIPQIAKKLASGDTIKIKVTIPEGFTSDQITGELTSQFQRSVFDQFQVKDFKDEFDFLKDSPGSASLEGFLFPDTYFFNPEDSDKEIIEKFLINFKEKSASWETGVSQEGKKIYEIITMASLIEKEVKTFEDKKLVSGILWKRLKSKMPLQIDATIAYITGKKTTKISIEETKIDSLYNTYKHLGLPLGPIANPGLESILAALYPESSDYWYYLSTSQGQTIFSKTLEAHNKARAEYLK